MLANVHETKWTPHYKRKSDLAQSYTGSDGTPHVSDVYIPGFDRAGEIVV